MGLNRVFTGGAGKTGAALVVAAGAARPPLGRVPLPGIEAG